MGQVKEFKSRSLSPLTKDENRSKVDYNEGMDTTTKENTPVQTAQWTNKEDIQLALGIIVSLSVLAINFKFDALGAQINALGDKLGAKIDGTNVRLDATNQRLDDMRAYVDAKAKK